MSLDVAPPLPDDEKAYKLEAWKKQLEAKRAIDEANASLMARAGNSVSTRCSYLCCGLGSFADGRANGHAPITRKVMCDRSDISPYFRSLANLNLLLHLEKNHVVRAATLSNQRYVGSPRTFVDFSVTDIKLSSILQREICHESRIRRNEISIQENGTSHIKHISHAR